MSSQSPPAAERRPQVVLVQPDIPWNTGNVGRTCLAAGAHLHLVRPLGFSLDARHLRRAGLDYWPHVKPTIWPSWAAFESTLPDLGEAFFFSAEAEQELWQVDFPADSVLVFGRETEGLPAPIRQTYRTRLVKIPMAPGPVRSLNLSTAVAIALYEVRRRHRSVPPPI